jgi:hypothetical protein
MKRLAVLADSLSRCDLGGSLAKVVVVWHLAELADSLQSLPIRSDAAMRDVVQLVATDSHAPHGHGSVPAAATRKTICLSLGAPRQGRVESRARL